MSIRMELTNRITLENELKKLNDDIKAEVYETLIALTRAEVETKAKRNVPVDSGRLKASIMTITKERTSYNYTDRKKNSYDGKLRSVNPKEYEIFVGSNVEYAVKIHERGGGGEGSRRTFKGQKKPKGYGRYFLSNAFEEAVPKMIKAIRRIRGID